MTAEGGATPIGPGPADGAAPSGAVHRRGDEPEFSRVAAFTDGVFAIALTLLVLDVRLPDLEGDPSDPAVLWEALADLSPRLVSFGVAFAVLAGYWLANHRFYSRLEMVDRAYLRLNMAYLAFVAFLPFPTSLVGEHEDNPLSGVVFALSLAAVSTLEAALLGHAHRAGLMREHLDEAGYRRQLTAALQPSALFVVTIPLAFVHTTVMLISWLVLSPVLGLAVNRRRQPRQAQ